MIIGFLGKGGSGKSSLSTQMALFLHSNTKNVMAIDADHNMDLSYNLTGGNISKINYFGQSLKDIEKSVGLTEAERYADAFVANVSKRFTLDPVSEEIEQYSTVLANGVRLMTAGEQTDRVLYGQACSHVLTTPLKILLPLLELQESDVVVVDEKAGADGVSTGIVTGIDVGVIVCEPALHSIKTAQQIAELMAFYETPYMFVGNKIRSNEDKDFITTALGEEPVAFVTETTTIKRTPSLLVTEWSDELQAIADASEQRNQNDRLLRTMRKFKRNKEFSLQ